MKTDCTTHSEKVETVGNSVERETNGLFGDCDITSLDKTRRFNWYGIFKRICMRNVFHTYFQICTDLQIAQSVPLQIYKNNWIIKTRILIDNFCQHILRIAGETALRKKQNCESILIHYLSHCWPIFLSPYGITRGQWVEIIYHTAMSSLYSCIQTMLTCVDINDYPLWYQ